MTKLSEITREIFVEPIQPLGAPEAATIGAIDLTIGSIALLPPSGSGLAETAVNWVIVKPTCVTIGVFGALSVAHAARRVWDGVTHRGNVLTSSTTPDQV